MIKIDFMTALNAIGEYKTVECDCGGSPIVYKVVNDELTVNGEITDMRDFCFSPSQILFGKWTIKQED